MVGMDKFMVSLLGEKADTVTLFPEAEIVTIIHDNVGLFHGAVMKC